MIHCFFSPATKSRNSFANSPETFLMSSHEEAIVEGTWLLILLMLTYLVFWTNMLQGLSQTSPLLHKRRQDVAQGTWWPQVLHSSSG